MSTRLEIRTLGRLAIGADRPVQLPTRKTTLLFVYLCLHAGEAISRDKLKGLLWSDRGEEQASASLRRALADIRKAAGDAVLEAASSTVKVVADAVDVDAIRFVQGLNSAVEDDHCKAAMYYRGDLLSGIAAPDAAFEDWLKVKREQMRGLAERLCWRLASEARGLQCIESSEALAMALLSEDPTCEEAHRALIVCFLRTGRNNAAVRQYTICSQALRSALGVEPEDQTKRLLEGHGNFAAAPQIGPGPVRPRAVAAAEDLPMIAVLPFNNMSDDGTQRYFADGLTEDIITELARFSSLSVVARNSTFVYRDQAVDLVAVGKSLGAQYVVEGSVRKLGDRVRLTAQLIDAADGRHVWAERYDRQLEDIFALQDELVHDIVTVLPGQIEASDRKHALRKPARNMAAYDYYLQALECERRYDQEGIVAGRRALDKAVLLDPGFARAHALLAYFTFAEQWFADVVDEDLLNRAVALAQRAVELDPNDNDCYAKLGTAYLNNCDYGQARHYLERAIEMNPHDSWTWSHYAWYLTTVGEHEKSLGYMSQREAIDPFPPNWHWETKGISEYSLGRYREAAVTLGRIAGEGYWIHGFLAACYGQLDEPEKAQAHWSRMMALQPQATLESVFSANSNMMQLESDVEHWLDGLRKGGITP